MQQFINREFPVLGRKAGKFYKVTIYLGKNNNAVKLTAVSGNIINTILQCFVWRNLNTNK